MRDARLQDSSAVAPPSSEPSGTSAATGLLSERERQFEHWRKKAGFILAPAVLLLIWFLPIPGLEENQNAHRLMAIIGFVVMLWITESIPLPVTALLGPAMCVMAGIGSARDVFRTFADPIMFLFIGSFLLAQGMFQHGLNRRIAFQILGLKAVGESPTRLLLAFGCITAFLSMWIGNTTVAAMMYPIGLAILAEMARRLSMQTGRELGATDLRFSTGLMLMTGFAAAAGGLATPVGAAPNLIAKGMIRNTLGIDVTFFQWMVFGVPVALALVVMLVFYLNRVCPTDADLMRGNSLWIRAEKGKLGRLTRGELNVLVAFLVTVTLWLTPGILAISSGTGTALYQFFSERLPESVAALIGASLLFLLPVDFRRRQFTLTWRQASGIDWGTILLFGGGLTLGSLMFATGLANWIGDGLAGAMNADTTLALVVLFTFIASTVSQVTSNTAAGSMAVPVAIAVAQAAGVNALQPALAACLGAGLGCMLPVSSPPMAIVYGSGCVPITKMVKHGFVLSLAGNVVIIVAVTWLVPLLF